MDSVNSHGPVNRQKDRVPAAFRAEPDVAYAISYTEPVLPISGRAGNTERDRTFAKTASTDATAIPGRRLTSNDHHAAATRVPQPWKL